MTDIADHWRRLIADASAHLPQPVQAVTPVQRLRGASHPVVVDCDDGQRYVVKGRQVKRSLIADQVVGRLATIVGAPVPNVQLVDVPDLLIAPGSFLEHFETGIGHGSLFVAGCQDSWYVQFTDEESNVDRFAALAVLYGWIDPEDRQFLYTTDPTHRVYSVDHGAFFTGSSDWSVESLNNAPPAAVDWWVASGATVGGAALQVAVDRLRLATDSLIAEAVAIPPDEWGITHDGRVALAKYLASRRDDLLANAAV